MLKQLMAFIAWIKEAQNVQWLNFSKKTPQIKSNLSLSVEKLEVSPLVVEDCELTGRLFISTLVEMTNVDLYFEGFSLGSIMELENVLGKMDLFLGMEFVE